MSDEAARLNAALADRYRIGREIGHGGMATVYLAEDLKHHRPVALKVLHADLAASIGAERFLREIEITARLQHPHILTLIDSGEAGGFLYYVMPFVDGTSLRARLIREHELPLADTLRILREVADALAEAHSHGVVHRDIKPDNVLLRGQHAVVTDFGVAKAVSEATGRHPMTTVGVSLGTPAYMSPEQAAGDPATDHRADIYALGVMAYEMLTGQPPFTGTTPQAVLSAHMTQAPEPVTRHRAAVPAPVAELVMRCLEKKPADRWQKAEDVLHQLEAMSTPGTGTMPSTIPLVPALKRWTKGRAAAAVAVVAVAGALGYVLLSGRLGGGAGEGHLPTLAVLPFENLGAADDEYFADGMTEELTGRLAKVSGLAVIARTSAIQYKKTTKSIPQIAKELGADFLVEGTVRWEKNADGTGSVRIAPQVVRAKNGTHVWAERYDKPYGAGIFEIQSEIAERVTEAVSVRLVAGEQKAVQGVPTRNIQAYDYYLRGLAFLNQDLGQNWEAQRQALELFKQALREDSTFASAQSLIALTHWKMATGGYDLSLPSGVSIERRMEQAREAAERALRLDPGLPRAHWILGLYFNQVHADTARFRSELADALRSNPSDAASIADRGWFRFNNGDREQGILDLQKAASLDPQSPARLLSIGWAFGYMGNYAVQEEYLDRAIAVAPAEPTAHVSKTWLNLMQGRVDRSRAAMREGVRLAGLNAVLFRASQHSLWINIIRMLPDEYAPPVRDLDWAVFGADSVDYYDAKANAYHTNPSRARDYYDSLAAWAAPRAHRDPSSPDARAFWAKGLAGSGHPDAAKREIRRLVADKRVLWSGLGQEGAAEACVLAGEYDCAIERIRLAMNDPYVLTPALLKIDPIWDPLRKRADFQKLLEQK